MHHQSSKNAHNPSFTHVRAYTLPAAPSSAMANHRAAALLAVASLLVVAVALADARLTVHLDKLGRGRGIYTETAHACVRPCRDSILITVGAFAQ